MTMYDYVRESKCNFKNVSSFYKLFRNFSHNSNVLKLFYKPWLCLLLFTFAYLFLPLFTFVQMKHLCINFVLVFFYKFDNPDCGHISVIYHTYASIHAYNYAIMKIMKVTMQINWYTSTCNFATMQVWKCASTKAG